MKKTKAICKKFLLEIGEHGNASKAARACGVSRQCVYQWKKEDPIFSRAWDSQIEEFIDNVEEEIINRARYGAEYEAMNADGEVVTLRSKPSDQLAKFILESRRYRPTTEQNVNVNVRHLVKVSDAQLAQIALGDAPALPAHVEDAELLEDDGTEELIGAAAETIKLVKG